MLGPDENQQMYGYGRGRRGQSSDPGDRSEGLALGPAPPVLVWFSGLG